MPEARPFSSAPTSETAWFVVTMNTTVSDAPRTTSGGPTSVRYLAGMGARASQRSERAVSVKLIPSTSRGDRCASGGPDERNDEAEDVDGDDGQRGLHGAVAERVLQVERADVDHRRRRQGVDTDAARGSSEAAHAKDLQPHQRHWRAPFPDEESDQKDSAGSK